MAREPILVVDDNLENMTLTSFLLEIEGYVVATAPSAEDALEVLRSFKPRMILMDMQMPGIDGYTLTRRLKADAETRDIIVVAVTAYAMKGDEQRAIAAGCDGYVAKPIDTRAFPGIIASLLRSAPPA